MRLPAIVELIRPWNCLLAGLAVLIGFFVAHELARVTLGGWTGWELYGDLNRAALVFAAAALITGAGNALNDYCDRDIDRVNRPQRPIPSGRIKVSDVLSLSQILFIVGIALTIFVNVACVIIAALNSGILALYAAGLKRRGLLGNLAIGYLVGSTFLFGGLALEETWGVASVIPAVIILAVMAALSTVGRELIKDVEDMRGDRKLGMETFPLRHGARKAAILATGFICAAIVLSPTPYLLGVFRERYLIIVIAAIVAFIWAAATVLRSQKPPAVWRASLACKIAMGIGLLAFLVGTLG